MKYNKTIIIPKEEAVFYLDSNGKWQNQHGEFQKKSISDYFHASIQKDEFGYHLCQVNGDILEKVYFRHEDTALFVFNIARNPETNELILKLNTGLEFIIEPEQLFIKNDFLYLKKGSDLIKFSERCLMQLSKFIEEINNRFFLNYNDRKYSL